jgi:hypothetical protein
MRHLISGQALRAQALRPYSGDLTFKVGAQALRPLIIVSSLIKTTITSQSQQVSCIETRFLISR